jgi:anti-sigma factor RsiW
MQHLDEGTIHSWLDGALSADEAARVEAHVKECPQCASAVAEARGFIAAASRILTALDNAPRGVVPVVPPRRRVDPLVWRVAASVLVVAAGTLVVVRTRGVNERVMSSSTDSSSTSQHASSIPAGVSMSTGPASAPIDKRASKATVGNAPMRAVSGRAGAPAGPEVQARDSKALAAGAIPQTGRSAAASEVAGGAASTAPAFAPSRAAGVVAMGAESDLEPLKVVSATRRIGANVTLYEVAPGDTVTLTETIPLSLDLVVVTGVGTPIARQATGKSAPATSKARADAALAAAPDSQRPARAPLSAPTASASVRAQVGTANSYRAIRWPDPATGNTLTLTGQMPEARLQEIRIRIERERTAAAKKSP